MAILSRLTISQHRVQHSVILDNVAKEDFLVQTAIHIVE